MGENIDITPEEIETIRALDDFDITMLLSEVNDHGWFSTRALLVVMKTAQMFKQ
jgi:hypothetical protein